MNANFFWRSPWSICDPPQVRPRDDLWTLGMISAPRSVRTVENSLRELRQAGFAQTVHVFEEPETEVQAGPRVRVYTNPQRLGLWPNWRQAASRLLEWSETPFVLLCEDDITLAHDAALALQYAIDTLPHENWGYASLYTPWNNIRYHRPRAGWQTLRRSPAWGALALCFSRESLEWILHQTEQHRDNAHLHTDLLIVGSCGCRGLKGYYHVPSLCAHAGQGNSSVGHGHLPEMAAVGFRRDRRLYRAAGRSADSNAPSPQPAQRDNEGAGVVRGSQLLSVARPGAETVLQTRGSLRRPDAVSKSAGQQRPIPVHCATAVSRLAVVTPLFNPAGYRRLRDNYLRYAREIRRDGVDLWTVELAFGDHWTAAADGQTLRLRADPRRHALWQKERLLNRLVECLPAEYDAVAWVDGDLRFARADWHRQSLKWLARYPVVQLFSDCWQEPANGPPRPLRRSTAAGHLMGHPRFLKFSDFHPGFAWAMRRETWQQLGGLLDHNVVGSGDAHMCLAFWGARGYPSGITAAWERRLNAWSESAFRIVQGRVGCVPGRITHMYHGSFRNRQYLTRNRFLTDHGFDPDTDLIIDDQGLWVWSERAQREKPQMVRQVAGYFADRRDDG